MNIGIFGGSFDPPHLEHVRLAAAAVESLNLDKLFVVPAHTPPHKKDKVLSSDEDRLEMCRIAFNDWSADGGQRLRDPTRRDQLHLSHLSPFSGVIPFRKALLAGGDGYAPRLSHLAESGGNFVSRRFAGLRARGKTGLDGKGAERFYRAFQNGFCDYPLRRKRRFLDGRFGYWPRRERT